MTRQHWPQAARLGHIRSFHVMALLARARELEVTGRSIVHLEIGEPDFPTPAAVIEAGHRALQRGDTFYTPAAGLPELRRAISAFYRERQGINVPAERILVTPGASGALLLALAAVAGPGDEVLLADPGYPANRHFLRLLDAVPVEIAAGPDSAYQLAPALIDRHWGTHTRAALVASPSNPTGSVLDAAALDALAQSVAQHSGVLIVDEIYQGLVYEGSGRSVLATRDDVFVVNSFSKYFGMTGWRLGWLVAPASYVEAVERIAQNIFLAASTPAQHAALAAFEPQTLLELERRRGIFRERRDFLLPALRDLGFGVPQVPQGAFYLYADSSRLCADSFAFTRDLLEQAGVAIAPGIDFGVHRAQAHVRLAYTRPVEVLQEGIERMRSFLGARS